MPNSTVPQLLFILVVFAAAYATFAVHNLRRRMLDLYDFPLLLTLAIVPLLFAGWPALTGFIGTFFGVALPLTVMFGLLFVAVFLILHRMIYRLHLMESKLTRAVQEIGLMEERLSRNYPTDKPAASDNVVMGARDAERLRRSSGHRENNSGYD